MTMMSPGRILGAMASMACKNGKTQTSSEEVREHEQGAAEGGGREESVRMEMEGARDEREGG